MVTESGNFSQKSVSDLSWILICAPKNNGVSTLLLCCPISEYFFNVQVCLVHISLLVFKSVEAHKSLSQ